MDDSRNRLTMPIHPMLKKFIRFEFASQEDEILRLLDEVGNTSKNHYLEAMRVLEPILKSSTKSFVDKVFMFRKRLCKDGSNCFKQYCLFAHNDDELAGGKRSYSETDYVPQTKKFKMENNELIFNKVDENMYSADMLKSFASKFGSVSAVRRLNKGKYLIIFDDAESARNLIESGENVLDDPEIKKFFNVNVPLDQNKKVDINQLFQEQSDLIDRLSYQFDQENFATLKTVTFKIRHQIINSDKKSVDSSFSDQYGSSETEHNNELANSIYYQMFSG